MADIYNSGFSRNNKRRRASSGKGRRSWLVAPDIFVWLMMVVLTAATIICTVTPHVEPERMGWLSLVALGAPIIYIFDLIVALWWVVRGRWYNVAIASVAVVIGLFSVGRYYRIDPTRNPSSFVERRFVKAISYNVANGKAEGIVDYVKRVNPDIIALQEFLIDVNEEWLKLGDSYRSTISGATDFSCEIITRHRILRHGEIDSISRYTANWADLFIKRSEDTVRVINLHLQSTSLRSADTQFIEEHEYLVDTASRSRISSIATRLCDNNVKRAEQARRIKRFIDSSPYPVIVCGDFNDVPLSYTYNNIAEGLNDTFRERGVGYAHTFNGFFNLMRIDYMLVSDRVEVVTCDVDDTVHYSDHYPVICRLRMKKK
ncbi:MAG: endonuclease/exonuclease/phosphatase family protein [Alistipes sp.]|nr:endonuclease/exonuclease/phosphatase family protein [Alistipes sp.]